MQLVATPIGPGLPKFQAYHTSVLLNGVGYFFSPQGVATACGLWSHVVVCKGLDDTIVLDLGVHVVNERDFESLSRGRRG